MQETRLAFPIFLAQTVGGQENGITAEEFFAAQAPDTIPDWFVHSMDEYGPRPQRPLMPSTHFSTNPLYVRHWDSEIGDWGIEEGEITADHKHQKEIILAYYEHYQKTTAAAAQWELQNKIERYFQWRAFYGVTMAGMKLGLPGSSYGLVTNALKGETKEDDHQ